MKRVAAFSAIALVLVLAFAWPELLAFMHGAKPDNKNRIYVLREALVPGMTVARVIEAVEHSEGPLRQRQLNSDRLVVSTPVGFLENVYLEMDFSAGGLVHARVRGELGHVLRDAPKDF